jgi:hypothetical protein
VRSFASQTLARGSGRLYSPLLTQQCREEAESVGSLSHERFFSASQSQGSEHTIQIVKFALTFTAGSPLQSTHTCLAAVAERARHSLASYTYLTAIACTMAARRVRQLLKDDVTVNVLKEKNKLVLFCTQARNAQVRHAKLLLKLYGRNN